MRSLTSILLFLAALGLAGCEKEKVLDIEAPGVDIEVDEGGDTTIDVD